MGDLGGGVTKNLGGGGCGHHQGSSETQRMTGSVPPPVREYLISKCKNNSCHAHIARWRPLPYLRDFQTSSGQGTPPHIGVRGSPRAGASSCQQRRPGPYRRSASCTVVADVSKVQRLARG